MPDQPSRTLIPPAARPLWIDLADVLATDGPAPCEVGQPDDWWPARDDDPAPTAATGCAECPVRTPCLAYALAADERHGGVGRAHRLRTPGAAASGRRVAPSARRGTALIESRGPTLASVRAATICVVLAAMLAGCSSTPSSDRAEARSVSAPSSSSAPSAIDASTLVRAQYPECDRGAQILRYLTTGDNGGVPELDQAFAEYVGVADPQARAVASDWIDACNARSAEAEASLAAEASRAAESAAAAQREAAIRGTTERSCASIGGVVNDGFLGGCVSTVPGNPSGQLGADCPSAWVGVDGDGHIVQSDLDFAREHDPGCFR